MTQGSRSRFLRSLAAILCVLPFLVSAQGTADPAQMRRDAVAAILRAPTTDDSARRADEHAASLKELGRALGFDALPVAGELLLDNRLGTDAARAMIAIDRARALPIIFGSFPQAVLSTQLVAFMAFLEHEDEATDGVEAAAHDAAERILARIESTGIAELALYTIGATGSALDFPLLERFTRVQGFGAEALQSGSQSALARLGQMMYFEAIRAEVARPLPSNPTYRDGLRVAASLRKAALTRSASLVPAVCGHIGDPALGGLDVVDPGRAAGAALSLILEPGRTVMTTAAPKRSVEEWKAYCGMLPAQ